MAEPKFEVSKSHFSNGVFEIHLPTWLDFVTYIHAKLVDLPDFVWRGQRSERWPIEPGLEREMAKSGVAAASDEGQILRFKHLSQFKLSARGRLDPRDFEERFLTSHVSNDPNLHGADTTPLGPKPAEREENNWWAVGQHYGLKTPLLDWSTSPYVAAFFTFSQMGEGKKAKGRAIYGLHRTLVEQKSDEIREQDPDLLRPPVLDFIEPLYKDNPRLVSQGGLFTRAPDGVDVRAWVEANHEPDVVWLLKFVLPNDSRAYILQALNRMNINHQSLFPDLYGATEFVNFQLTIKNY